MSFLFSSGKTDQSRRNFRVACDSNLGHQDGKSGFDHCAVKPLKVSSRVHKHSCVVFWHQCLLTSVTQNWDFGLQQHRQTVSRRPELFFSTQRVSVHFFLTKFGKNAFYSTAVRRLKQYWVKLTSSATTKKIWTRKKICGETKSRNNDHKRVSKSFCLIALFGKKFLDYQKKTCKSFFCQNLLKCCCTNRLFRLVPC